MAGLTVFLKDGLDVLVEGEVSGNGLKFWGRISDISTVYKRSSCQCNDYKVNLDARFHYFDSHPEFVSGRLGENSIQECIPRMDMITPSAYIGYILQFGQLLRNDPFGGRDGGEKQRRENRLKPLQKRRLA